MKAIDARLQPLFARFDALTRRERMLLAIALVGGVLMVGNTLFIDLPLAKASVFSKQWVAGQDELLRLRQQTDALSREQFDPDAENRRLRQELDGRLKVLRQELDQYRHRLVTPDEAPRLLEQLVARHAHLRLLSLRTLPPQQVIQPGDEAAPAVPPPAEPAGKAEAALKATQEAARRLTLPGQAEPEEKPPLEVWRHSIEVRLEGSYADLQRYVAELEKYEGRLGWGEVRLVADYPKTTLSLTLHTYSLEAAWFKF